jgi:ABC-2 type transport system ATP-binding protein
MYQGKLIAIGSPLQLKTGSVKGELIEIVSSDFAKTLELLSADSRYRQASLFGSAVHVVVDDAAIASPKIRSLLESARVTLHGINRIPLNMEDVFIALMEEQNTLITNQQGG